jgi:hydroxyethylthiazole kinase-like uncharacterized protein yjeF
MNIYSDIILINQQDIINYIIKAKKINNVFIIDAIIEGIPIKYNIPKNYWIKLIKIINHKFVNKIISLNAPSGLTPDNIDNKNKNIIQASLTLTLTFPKISFLFSNTEKYIGKWYIIKPCKNTQYINNIESKYYYIDNQLIKKLYKPRKQFSHKGTYGTSLIIGGSYNMIGSINLTAKANMRSGSGKVIIYIPQCGYLPVTLINPEIIIHVDKNFTHLKNDFDDVYIKKYNINSIGIGPGIGCHPDTINFIKRLLIKTMQHKIPVVIDADAINILSKNMYLLQNMPNNTILTPHPKEFRRLVNTKWVTNKKKIKTLNDISYINKLFIILKGKHTIISCPNKNIFFNSTGNSGMATAGSGDVLTGIITSLLSQNYSIRDACILGVYIHGLSGDIYAKNKSKESLIATDIIDNISNAFNYINKIK